MKVRDVDSRSSSADGWVTSGRAAATATFEHPREAGTGDDRGQAERRLAPGALAEHPSPGRPMESLMIPASTDQYLIVIEGEGGELRRVRARSARAASRRPTRSRTCER